MQSFHEQIIAAAVAKDQVALSQVLSLSSIDAIDVLDRNYLSPVGLLSSRGDIASADFLITNGASIDEAVFGAALGGHQVYADALIECGASIENAVDGAAAGGHQAYAEALILRGASIDWAVFGAAAGGHQACADALRIRKPELIKRSEDIASMMSKDKLSFPAALTATDPDSKIACGIILYLAMRPNSKTLPLATYLIPDVWGIVLDYAMPMKLSTVDRHGLGFVLGLPLLEDELRYANGHKPAYKDRANSLVKAPDSATSPDKLDALLQEELKIILGHNPNGLFGRLTAHKRDINPTKDGFLEIIEEHADATGASLPSIKPCECAAAGCTGACQDTTPKSAP
jgi:hypothetical protein